MRGEPPSLEALAWTAAVLLPAAAVVSVLSALLERSGPIRLSHWAEEAGGGLRALYDQPVRFSVFRSLLSLASRLLTIGLYMAAAALFAAAGMLHPRAWALAITALLLLGVEVTNRALVGRKREQALRALTILYRLALIGLLPLVAAVSRAAGLTARVRGARPQREDDPEEDDAASHEEIEAFIDVGTREGIIEPEQGEWLSNIVGFPETQARSVMTPRIDMVCAPVASTLDAVAERFVESGHTRIPLYQDSIDHIVGVLHIVDLLEALREPEPPAAAGLRELRGLRELAKPPLFIPETKPLAELLKELQARSQQMAIVVDEYGGTAGLVTVEDLVEEIVGEISGEHEDAQPAERTPLGDGAWRLDGRAHLDVLEELFGVEIEDAEYETVAGLIFSALGHVPHSGEVVETAGLRLTVEEVASRRIKTLRVERLPPAAAEEPAAEGNPA
ncbi:MAG: HlyC/CorC family transporter [Acidobacteria bacterium]|nr:HlyC/CorC family transporter [Acidobacteriota bacterium]